MIAPEYKGGPAAPLTWKQKMALKKAQAARWAGHVVSDVKSTAQGVAGAASSAYNSSMSSADNFIKTTAQPTVSQVRNSISVNAVNAYSSAADTASRVLGDVRAGVHTGTEAAARTFGNVKSAVDAGRDSFARGQATVRGYQGPNPKTEYTGRNMALTAAGAAFGQGQNKVAAYSAMAAAETARFAGTVGGAIDNGRDMVRSATANPRQSARLAANRAGNAAGIAATRVGEAVSRAAITGSEYATKGVMTARGASGFSKAVVGTAADVRRATTSLKYEAARGGIDAYFAAQRRKIKRSK